MSSKLGTMVEQDGREVALREQPFLHGVSSSRARKINKPLQYGTAADTGRAGFPFRCMQGMNLSESSL